MNNLKILREKLGKTQVEIADIVHVSEKTYRDYENEKNEIPSGICIALSEYYSKELSYTVTIDYLLGRDYYSFQDKTLLNFAEKTHLSDNAISNIIYEGSDKGNNSRVQMLDLLLSDRETFINLMDNMINLVSPPTLAIPTNPIPDVFKLDDNTIKLTSETIIELCDYLPDNTYREMRHVLDIFSVKKKNIKIIAPNAFHPIIGYFDANGDELTVTTITPSNGFKSLSEYFDIKEEVHTDGNN